jgi:hypothetical protein
MLLGNDHERFFVPNARASFKISASVYQVNNRLG